MKQYDAHEKQELKGWDEHEKIHSFWERQPSKSYINHSERYRYWMAGQRHLKAGKCTDHLKTSREIAVQ